MVIPLSKFLSKTSPTTDPAQQFRTDQLKADFRCHVVLGGTVAATAVVSAWYGAGYWALVMMSLTSAITTTVGVWVMCGWRPGPLVRHSGVRSLLAFGGHMTGSNVLIYFTRNLDNLLIGRYWGAQQLGLYAKAYQLLLMPLQQINAPISSVAIPTLSCLQSDPQGYVAYYRKAIMLIAGLGMPIVAFLFVAADKVILTLLGSQWMSAVIIFRVLALAVHGHV